MRNRIQGAKLLGGMLYAFGGTPTSFRSIGATTS
jgi:hypothetical protein